MGAEVRLTRRSKEVAGLVALGLTNREIASRLFLSERTVEWHVEQIMNKLGFSSRSQIAAWIGRSQPDTAISAPGSRTRGNLPAQITSFIGRERELSALLDLVTANRLVTVIGAGGTGKTRLALRLAEELQPDFPHGVWFCDLAPVAGPDLVADAVRQALGVKGSETLRDRLRDQSALLVLDNCEHVLTASAGVARDLLASCPAVRVLTTSRMPLGVIGEAIWRLEPLPHEDAVRLFEERAAAAVPGFQSSEPVGAICRQLDGVPLAIELVVPRLRVQSADELAAAVLDPVWRGKSHDRHGSVESLVEWSYRLMEPAQQALFRRLGVFSGWFDATDTAAVAPASNAPVSVQLGSIAEQSMVVQEQAQEGTRYRLLEILKAFALQRLEEDGELEETRLLHAEHLVGLVGRIDHPGDAPPVRHKVMSTMVDDIRAALTLLLRVDPRRAAWLNARMMSSWSLDGRTEEGLRWGELTLAANPQPCAERCWNLFANATALGELRRLDEAAESLRQAEAFADLPANEDLRRQTLIIRALSHDEIDDFSKAVEIRAEAIAELEASGDERTLAVALNHNAMSLLFASRPREAVQFARRSVEIRRRLDTTRLPYTLDTLAQAHAMLGELTEARACWMEALERCIESWEPGLPDCLYGLALVESLEGNEEETLRLYFLSEVLRQELHTTYWAPIMSKLTEVVSRLLVELGPETVERLRTESALLTPRLVLSGLKTGSIAL